MFFSGLVLCDVPKDVKEIELLDESSVARIAERYGMREGGRVSLFCGGDVKKGRGVFHRDLRLENLFF